MRIQPDQAGQRIIQGSEDGLGVKIPETAIGVSIKLVIPGSWVEVWLDWSPQNFSWWQWKVLVGSKRDGLARCQPGVCPCHFLLYSPSPPEESQVGQ